MSISVNILLVDDRPENLLALEVLLEGPEIKLFRATSGNEALSLLLQHDFALVLLDVQMPEMDGFEVAELMRTKEKTRNIPIIFVTAISKEKSFVFRGYESGAVDYLLKPLDPVILKSKVDIFCQLFRQKEEIRRQLEEIKILRGILPICMHCKKIRNDEGYWESLEGYISEHSEADFSHGVCEDCQEKYYGDFLRKE